MSSWGCSWKALLSVVVTEVLKIQAEDITKVKKKKLFISFIIYSTHYHFSDWPKAYSEFSKSAPGTSSSCSMIIWYDNHIMYDRGAWFLRVIMSGSRAVCCLLICIFFKCLEINYQFHLLAWPFFSVYFRRQCSICSQKMITWDLGHLCNLVLEPFNPKLHQNSKRCIPRREIIKPDGLMVWLIRVSPCRTDDQTQNKTSVKGWS